MNQVTPFLTFASRGKEAVDFYLSVFKDSKLNGSMTLPGTGQLLHASFSLNGQEFMAMEAAGDNFKFEDGCSFFVSCQDQAEVDYYWDKLSADGGEPGRCGWLKDQFGVSWQIIPTALGRLMSDSDQAKAAKVRDCMLKMNKIIVTDLEKAAA